MIDRMILTSNSGLPLLVDAIAAIVLRHRNGAEALTVLALCAMLAVFVSCVSLLLFPYADVSQTTPN